MFVALTVATQVGGFIWIATHLLARRLEQRGDLVARTRSRIALFTMLYAFVCAVVVPVVAAPLGRYRLPWRGEVSLRPHTVWTLVLNRGYVTPSVEHALIDAATEIARSHPGTTTFYFDAGFPFARWFPMWPHRSHRHGDKVDVAFFYRRRDSHVPTVGAPGWIGYGAYQHPLPGEHDQPRYCAEHGYWQYGLLGRLVPGANDGAFELDPARTRQLIHVLARDARVGRMFIEPHLRTRLGISSRKVGYHGCYAVRHDDHLHIEGTSPPSL
jgi:hypothetical protein